MDIEPQLRAIADAITRTANLAAVFDIELDDPNAGAAYKLAIKARIKTRLQVIDTALQSLITALG